MKLFLYLFFVGLLFTPGKSLACSLRPGPSFKISEYVSQAEYIFFGEVLYIDDRHLENIDANRVARFKPIRFLKSGEVKPETIDVHYNFFNSTYCDLGGAHFQTGRSYTVFVKRKPDAKLHAYFSSGKYNPSPFFYSQKEVTNYFDRGEDSFLLNPDCVFLINLAYSAVVFTNEFRFDDSSHYERCASTRILYDQKYRVGNAK